MQIILSYDLDLTNQNLSTIKSPFENNLQALIVQSVSHTMLQIPLETFVCSRICIYS